jgi:hypothetical protein
MGILAKWRRAPAAAMLLCAGLLAPAAVRDQIPLRGYLPADGAAAGWVRDGGPQEFEGEDLYTYIDGGAEIYQEYGFRRAAVQDYRDAAGREVSLEIFEMADPAAAFGMFTFKRSGKGAPLALGGGAELEAYYLNFWRGRFLVTLTGFDESPGTLEGLKALAGAAEKGLGAGGDVPGIVGLLDPEGLVAGSVKYLRGLLGLANVYPFGTARGLNFKEAVRGVYDGGETLIVLEYGSVEARTAAGRELEAALAASGRFERPGDSPADAVVLKDGKGNFLAFRGVGGRLAVGVHDTLDGALGTAARAR